MKWSLKIGRVAGIGLYIHATFLILVAWLAVTQYLGHQSAAATLATIALVGLVFVIIVLHELGHALAARRYGIETQDITLLPIGGVARLNKIPEDPAQELVVAFAGPLVNLVIAAGLVVGIAVSLGPSKVLEAARSGNFISQILIVNLWLAFFNLLPAFPMDGGRAFRALLAFRLNRVRATEIAVGVGHAMALIFGAVGLFVQNNPFLVFIALFIWVGADSELEHVRMQAFLEGVKVSDVMAANFEAVDAGTRLQELADRMVPGFQRDYPVLDDGRLVGFVGVADVAKGLSQFGPDSTVAESMQKIFQTAAPGDLLAEVLSAWRQETIQAIGVIESGELVGIVTPANIGEHIMVRSATMRSGREEARTPPPIGRP